MTAPMRHRPPRPKRFDRYPPVETIICGGTAYVVPDWIANGYPRVWSGVQGNIDRAVKWERACLDAAVFLAAVQEDAAKARGRA